MQQINIEKEGNLLSIKAPWNPLFIEELKSYMESGILMKKCGLLMILHRSN